ncbi:MAG: gliding motility-associated C-terminal domain-containing protein [Elusimicrobiota bacterium]
MVKILNQILKSATKRLSDSATQRLSPLSRANKLAITMLLCCYVAMSLCICLYAANPATMQMTCRPNMGPPTPVSDIASVMGAGVGEVVLTWTVPGEDPPPWYGQLLMPWPYHLRFSTNSLATLGNDTTAWWNQASEYPQGWSEQGKPAPGYTRSETITFTSDYYNQVVYLALRVEDSGHIMSVEFNISSATVRGDTVPPAAISDLTALAGEYEDQIKLQWTAPGDDGTTGNLTGTFRIRYAPQIITAANFETTGTEITVSTSSVIPCSQQSYLIQGLQSDTAYWFAIKTVDDQTNTAVWNSYQDVSGVNVRASTVTVDSKQPEFVSLSIGQVGFTSVELKWFAPSENAPRTPQLPFDNLTNGYYDIRFSTSGSIPDNVAWNSIPSSNRRVISTTTVIGDAQSYTVTGLKDDTTWWFCLRSIDDAGLISAYSNSPQAFTLDATPPAQVSNFAAQPLYAPNGREIQLTWTNPTDADYQGTLIVYSTGTPPTFTPVAEINYSTGGYIIYNGTGTSYTHPNLTSGVNHYYAAYSYDLRPNYSTAASTSCIAPPAADQIPPREPRGIRVALSTDRNSITIRWTAVTKSTDGTTSSDLKEYTLYRSTGIDAPGDPFTIPITVTSTNIYTGGQTYYYWLTCWDLSENESHRSAMTDSYANIYFCNETAPKTNIAIPPTINSIIYKENNSFGDDVYFDIVRLTDDEKGKVLRAYTFLPRKASSQEVVTGLLFSRALADIKISYEVSGGIVGAPAHAPITADKATDNLALFWYNGVEWIKVGGEVDTQQQTVSVKTKKGGKYQLRQSLRSQKFALTSVYPRIFSPNGDGWNDVVNFVYEGNDTGISGKVYDINGAFVSDMIKGDTGDSLRWDGKKDGKAVPSGIYIYQIEADGKVVNGTVVVAK